MKRILCLILATLMVISFCGCVGDTDTDDVRGDVVSGTNSENTDPTETEPEFSFGKTANNTYNNDFLGISCTLPAEWVFYTDEQILEMNNIVGDYYDDEVADLIESASIIYDMFASCQTDGSSININLEKLSVIQMMNLNIKLVLESQIDTIKSTYQNMGYTDINVVYQKTTVDDKEFDSLKITAKIQGIDFFATAVAFRKSSYLANVTVCSARTDETDTILNYFTVK